MSRCLVLAVITVIVLGNSPTWGQGPDSLALIGVHPEQMADVILLLEPHEAFPLNVPTPGERVIRGPSCASTGAWSRS